jgi:hypothetical protein
MTQCLGSGRIQDVLAGREWIRRSAAVKTYQPQNPVAWDEAHDRFLQLLAKA